MGKKFHYGGQAVIEGVMIRDQKAAVTAVRRPGGGLAMKVQPLSRLYTGRLRKLPFIRGVIVLIEAMVLGIRSLLYSANVSLEEEEVELSGKSVWLMLFASLTLAVALFFVAPLFLASLIGPYIASTIVFNLVEGVIRIAIFIAYLRIVALMPDIRRVFAYHGAEHKAVNAFEAGVPMEVAEVRRHDKAHVRCGTSFLFVVLIIAILVFALVGRPSLWLMVLSRIVLVPVIAALGYEVIYFGARHARNVLVRMIMSPGLFLQALTTREPDDDQLEVSVAAMNKALETDRVEEAAQAS